jgi:hypothetical protein
MSTAKKQYIIAEIISAKGFRQLSVLPDRQIIFIPLIAPVPAAAINSKYTYAMTHTHTRGNHVYASLNTANDSKENNLLQLFKLHLDYAIYFTI